MPCITDHWRVVPYESKELPDGKYYMANCLDCNTTLCRTLKEYHRTRETVIMSINGHYGHYEVWEK